MSLNLDNQSTNLKNIAWTTKQDIKLELLKSHESLSNGFVSQTNSISEDTRRQRDAQENNVSSQKMCNGVSEEEGDSTTTTSVSNLIYDSTTSSSTGVKSSVSTTIIKSEATEKIVSQTTVPSVKDCKVEESKELHSSTDSPLLPPPPISEQPDDPIEYVVYESELQMPQIMRLITKDLSEPYSIYTYRYFIHNWPKLCFLAMHRGECVGAIVCKLDFHKKNCKRGYIAMLAVDQGYRRKGIGSYLVIRAIRGMVTDNCDEVVLETEITNHAALHLYENLGFVRDKRLFRYYLNGVDALRLKLWLK